LIYKTLLHAIVSNIAIRKSRFVQNKVQLQFRKRFVCCIKYIYINLYKSIHKFICVYMCLKLAPSVALCASIAM